jgi:hypothetical protein
VPSLVGPIAEGLPASATDTLAPDTARRLMLRFGYADGYHDAVSLRDRSKWETAADGIRAGAVLHRLEGIVRADIIKVTHDTRSCRFEQEVAWHDSYVAEQHFPTTARAPRRCAGLWSGTRAGTSARASAKKSTAPPLRERREDIPPLVHDFVRRLG